MNAKQKFARPAGKKLAGDADPIYCPRRWVNTRMKRIKGQWKGKKLVASTLIKISCICFLTWKNYGMIIAAIDIKVKYLIVQLAPEAYNAESKRATKQ